MNTYYVSEYFNIKELVPPNVYETRGEKAWQFIDWRLVYTLDRIRKRYGKPVVVNNWSYAHEGPTFSYRGYRPRTYANGADFSEHRHGRAVDFHIIGMTAEEIRQDILANPNCEDFKYITCVEADVNWVHIDFRSWNKEENGILIVYP